MSLETLVLVALAAFAGYYFTTHYGKTGQKA